MTWELRPLGPEDEQALIDFDTALMAEGHPSTPGRDGRRGWECYLALLRTWETDAPLPWGRTRIAVRGAFDGPRMIGRLILRDGSPEYLGAYGHIGYAVLPEMRGQGIATWLAQESTGIFRREGLTELIVTCAQENAASAAVIRKCGGELAGKVRIPSGEMGYQFRVPLRTPEEEKNDR